MIFPFLCPFPFSRFLPFSFPFFLFLFSLPLSSFPFLVSLFFFFLVFLFLLSSFSFPSFLLFCSPFTLSHFLPFFSFSTPQSHSGLTWGSGKPPTGPTSCPKPPGSGSFSMCCFLRGKKKTQTTRNFPLKLLEFFTLWHCHRPWAPELNPLHQQKEGKKGKKMENTKEKRNITT